MDDKLPDGGGGMDDMTADERAALEALFSEPFPQKPFALVPEGGAQGYGETDYVIHRDYENERQCVLVFDSIVDAFAVAEEYKQATGKGAEPVPCDVDTLEEDRFWVKFYRANGVFAMMSLPDYKQQILPDEERL